LSRQRRHGAAVDDDALTVMVAPWREPPWLPRRTISHYALRDYRPPPQSKRIWCWSVSIKNATHHSPSTGPGPAMLSASTVTLTRGNAFNACSPLAARCSDCARTELASTKTIKPSFQYLFGVLLHRRSCKCGAPCAGLTPCASAARRSRVGFSELLGDRPGGPSEPHGGRVDPWVARTDSQPGAHAVEPLEFPNECRQCQ